MENFKGDAAPLATTATENATRMGAVESAIRSLSTFRTVGTKILVVVSGIVAVGLITLVIFYAGRQRDTILAQNERTLRKVAESVIQGLNTVMLAGYADIARVFSDRLKEIPDVLDFRILRTDGTEAFLDNKTLEDVNHRLGQERFPLRQETKTALVMPPDHPELQAALSTRDIVTYYVQPSGGERQFTLLATLNNLPACHGCHGDAEPVRGVLKLTTSLARVEGEIRSTWILSVAVLLATMASMIAIVNYVLKRSVVRPINTLTDAMVLAARGDFSQQVRVEGRDELAQMAESFNNMIRELLRTYSGLHAEQNKLTTILLSAQEGIVVTDKHNKIVLVNTAAERLLGKDNATIMRNGFLDLFDDPNWVQERLKNGDKVPVLRMHDDRQLSIFIASIRTDDGDLVGSAALIRDVTEEKRLQDELRRLSVTDGLTGLYNRRYFDEKIQSELDYARRYDHPLTLLLFDVDHFKKFNDTYGHDQGDRVLKSIAKVLQESLRTLDMPCRFGGEEFVALLPNTGLEEACAIAEHLRACVEQHEVDGLKVTVSIGLAACPPLPFGTPDQIIKASDNALYAAKEGGRNQVKVAKSLEAS